LANNISPILYLKLLCFFDHQNNCDYDQYQRKYKALNDKADELENKNK
jgi:hypothetical protein